MAFSIGSIFGRLQLETGTFRQDILGAQRSLNLTATSAEKLGAAAGRSEAGLAGAGREAGLASVSSGKLRAAQLSLVAAQERYNALLESGDASLSRMATAEAALIRANERVKASMPTAPIKAAAVEAESAGGAFVKAREGMGGMVESATKLGLAMGGFELATKGVEMVKAGAAFQQQMLQIKTLTGGTTTEVNRMSDAIEGLAGPVATAPNELATSLYHVESVGLRGAKALDVVKIAAEGAKVGMSDVEETTNALTSTVASGIPGVEDMSQAMGALITIVGAGDMKMSDLNEALAGGVLTVVKGYGLSLRDVGAALATFGDNNIRGADAATMLRMAVQALAVPAAEGKEQLHKLGLETDTLAKDMQAGGLNRAVIDLKQHLDKAGVSTTEVGSVLTTVFGKKAGPGVAVLIGQVDRFEQKLDAIKAGSGSFAEKWTETTHNAGFAFSKLGAEAEAAGIKIFNRVGTGAGAAATWLGTALPHAIGDLQAVLGPLEHEAGVVFVAAWHAAAGVLTVAGTAVADVTHFLADHKTTVTVVGTAVLGMWAAYKGYQVAVTAAKAVSAAFDAMIGNGVLKANAAISRLATGGGAAMLGFGLVVAAVGIKWQQHAAAVAQAKQVTAEYLGVLQQTKGAINDQVIALTTQKLAEDGAYDAAQKYGISATTVTQAALGNKQAIDDLTHALGHNFDAVHALGLPIKQQSDALHTAQTQYQQATDQAELNSEATSGVSQAQQEAADALGETTGAIQEQVSAIDALSQALDDLSGNAIDAQQAELDLLDTLANAPNKDKTTGGGVSATTLAADHDAVTNAMDRHRTAAQALTLAEKRLADARKAYAKDHTAANLNRVQSAELALTRAQDADAASARALALAKSRLADANKKNTVVTEKGSTSLDENTDAGRKNQEWLLGAIKKANQHAESVMKETNSIDSATKALKKDEDQIRKAAYAAGLNKDQVDALIKKYEAVPSEVRTRVIAETTQAKAEIDQVKQHTSDLYKWARGNRMLIAANNSDAMTKIAEVRNSLGQLSQFSSNGITIGLVGQLSAHAAGGRLDPGLNLVGERGPELLDSRSGRVYTASQTEAMRATGGVGHPATAGPTTADMAAAFRRALDTSVLRFERRSDVVLARIVRSGEQNLKGID